MSFLPHFMMTGASAGAEATIHAGAPAWICRMSRIARQGGRVVRQRRADPAGGVSRCVHDDPDTRDLLARFTQT
jgi:hypothetical protein